ncbi:hypothetical protein GGS24DRAFT_499368 [Hypoxylon argillaceum]|nr:hypothetical protein GGS24DRAFT_499368 [Hypoxylon argillaceum]
MSSRASKGRWSRVFIPKSLYSSSPGLKVNNVPVMARGEGDLVPRNDLKGFVPRILKLGRDNKLAPRFGEIGRAQAPLARWEAIGNGVAWKMDAVDQVQATKHCQHIITIAP